MLAADHQLKNDIDHVCAFFPELLFEKDYAAAKHH
jgi:hypothetical protein